MSRASAERGPSDPPAWRRRRILGWAGLLLLASTVTFGIVQSAQAARAGESGKRYLLAAERALLERRLEPARRQLRSAEASFGRMRRELRTMGPLLAVARAIPLVRLQVRGVEAFSSAGVLVSRAGLEVADATSGLLQPGEQGPISAALKELQTVRASLQAGVDDIERATQQVQALDGFRLVGPLASTRRDLRRDLVRISRRASSAEEGLEALIAFAGGSGPRRYLLFSQNPDEVRPTGGFMGTYGVLRASSEGISMERYEGIERWLKAHPEVVVPEDQVSSVFRYAEGNVEQSLANVNAVADWPAASNLALQLWEQGGEDPVDGVLSVTPAFLARILGVLGPVEVPAFGETVNRQNLIERFNFYTREDEARTDTGRVKKEFIADLASAVMDRLLAAPSRQWVELGAAVGRSLDLREAMAWSKDGPVAQALASRRWDGTLPVTGGDFFYDSEFEYAAKNGRALRRVFDHHVQLDEKGDALITTTLTVSNTEGPRPFNLSASLYHTIYGPAGARLDGSSEPPVSLEPPLRGHPAAAWFKVAAPLGSSTLKVVWRTPGMARRLSDGSWVYSLWFMHLPDHSGDVLNLRVELPSGWMWKDKAPPGRTNLEVDLVGAWRYSEGGP